MIRIEGKRYDATVRESWWKVVRVGLSRYDDGKPRWLLIITGRSLWPRRGWYVTVEPV